MIVQGTLEIANSVYNLPSYAFDSSEAILKNGFLIPYDGHH